MPSLFNSRLNIPIILAVVLGFAVSNVTAHGWVDTVTIDGKTYPGWRPFVDPYSDPVPERIVRKVASDGPVLNPQDPSIACNVDGEQGTGLVADVNGGSSVTFTWNTWPTDHHGPVTTWMASCGGDCTSFAASNAEFFKINQGGYIGPGQFWASDELINNNCSWTVTIPKTIQDGEYLVRHEILAMHSVGQPQFYPSCTQVRVNNGGSSTPASTEVVKATDIYDSVTFPDIWDGVTSFNIAGPAVAKMVTGGGSGSGNASPPPAASTSTAKHSSSTSTSSLSPGKSPAPKRCRTKKRSVQSLQARHAHSMVKRILRHERKSGSWLF